MPNKLMKSLHKLIAKYYFKKKNSKKYFDHITKANNLTKEQVQEAFEKEFGKDRKSRTKKQWIRLVEIYGIETVMIMEKMTDGEVRHATGFAISLKKVI